MSNEHYAALERFIRGSVEHIKQGWSETITTRSRIGSIEITVRIEQLHLYKRYNQEDDEDEEDEH